MNVLIDGHRFLEVLSPAAHAGTHHLAHQLRLPVDQVRTGDQNTGVRIESDLRQHQATWIPALLFRHKWLAEHIGLLRKSGRSRNIPTLPW